MFRPLRAVLAFLLLAAALSLPAVETSTPAQDRDRLTGSLDEVSLKPLFLFDMRGRKDPFVPYALVTLQAKSGTDISGLQFSGMLQVGPGAVALFTDSVGKPFMLRGGILYDPQDRPVAGVSGRVSEGDETFDVVLSQGERKLTFSYRRQSKRLDTSGQP